MHQVIVHLIVIAMLFTLFFMATVGRVDSRAVKQQVVEKQIALMIDSAMPGMDLKVYKLNKNGIIGDLAVMEGKVVVSIGGLSLGKGYPYFSKNKISVEKISEGDELNEAFVVKVR